MPKKNKKNSLYDIDIGAYLVKFLIWFIFIAFLSLCFWGYFACYKPKEKSYFKKTRYAYAKISQVLYDYYKKNGHLYTTLEATHDEICEELGKKLSNGEYDCAFTNDIYKMNFKIKNTPIALYGLSRPGYLMGSVIVKEFIIDVNGDKGENTFGIDRTPIMMYSSGRNGGMLSPVNCNIKDETEFAIPYGKICGPGVDIDFMDKNEPLGFDVKQVNFDTGETKKVANNVSFLRADCSAFGGEIIADEYCEQKKLYWQRSCYADYFCDMTYAK